MLRTVICDDEPPALELARTMLEATGKVEIVAACASVREALAIVNAGGVDLFVLDIDMPELTGVEAARALDVEPKPLLVFATAHPEYAVEAFGIDAIDYILKPLDPERVRRALEKTERLAGLIRHTRSAPPEAAVPEDRPVAPDCLRVRDGSRFFVFAHADIVWIEAAGDYSLVHRADSEIAVRSAISALESELPGQSFVRVHRSAIVSRAHIVEIRRLAKGEAEIRLDSGHTVRSSRRYRDVVGRIMAG